MKILEERHPGESWLLWKIGNLTTVPVGWVHSAGIAVGYGDPWTWRPFVTHGKGYDYFSTDALFWNAMLFLRFVWPLGVFIQARWSGAVNRKAFLQCGIGWKLNGRLAVLFRIQSDVSATDGAWSGVAGENVSTSGWALGHK